MRFHLGKPVLAMLLVAAAAGAVLLVRDKPGRATVEVWTFAKPHAELYERLRPDAERAAGGGVSVRVVPSNALNVRLVSLFMAGRAGDELPDVVEIRQDALGRYLGPPTPQVGFLPLNDLLATTGERTIASPEVPGQKGWSARAASDGRVYTHDGTGWQPDAAKPHGDRWIDRLVRQRLVPYTKDGLIFGLPHDVHPTTLTYRADLFAEAGVDLESPTPGLDHVSWPDFHERCLRFQAYWRSKGVADRWALDLFGANGDLLAAMLLQRGVNLVEPGGKVRLADPVVADTLLFYAAMVAGPRRASADSVSGGLGVWKRDLEAGVVCAVVTPDWRVADLRSTVGSGPLAGRFRMCRLPKFDAVDAPTTTWGGTMVAIPRRCRDPQRAWRAVEALYLSREATDAQARDLGILPAVADSWVSPAVRTPDPLFGGQVVNDLYVELAPKIPVQHLSPDSAYATSGLGYVLTQAVGAIRGGAEPASLRPQVLAWLAARQADVERQIAQNRQASP
ncbi:MAG TPA: extracellular solute-binding protein [Humisphaera sp.]